MSKHDLSERKNEYDDDVRAWLAPLAGESAAPPDAEFLRALGQRAAAEFARAAAPAAANEPTVLPALSRKRRALLAGAACAAALVVWFAVGFSDAARGGVTLGDVLRRTVAARSLHLELRRGGVQSEVWVTDGNRVRWDEAPGRYTIARGSQLWRVDEEANTAARAKSSWTTADDGVDLVAILEAGGAFELDGADQWLTSTSNGQAEYLGRPCLVFERKFTLEGGREIRLVAYADATTQQLQGLVAWPVTISTDQTTIDGPVLPLAPLAELRLVARNVTVDEEKFVVAESLTEDGRIGKVLDVQGMVALQPPLARRWTPVCGPILLKPGDWVRTETRGANAARMALSSQVELTLGPSGLVELISPTRIRVLSGEVQAKVAAGASEAFTLLGKSDAAQTVDAGASAIFRRRDADAELQLLTGKPQWLAGFEGSTNNESLGSLIATVDGRSVPLSVGYHKVTVDIRDQIARTTIEESFVNHTPGRLEGVFYFPLPADASISGFGMWIGGELVEADVVEKQRAREIYETILREKRDPGLLEWTSGNLFKARVFPIEPHSEKRVKLVYTQVLPLRDNRYVYSYGLRSELLRTRPLRELDIDVRVSSELPMRSVSCPTHDVRSELTGHAAHVQFAAQEYAPTRDFEVVCEIDGRQSDVVVIPHQRGEDGYFLVQLTPPAPAGNWRRETLGEGEPLDVLLVCDTSGSMDSECRRQQREFVATVLASLGEGDKFNLAASDVETTWAFEGESATPTAERIDEALAFLDARQSLGWTDLEKTFTAVLERANSGDQVIYIGDGVPSAGDADPQALAVRLRRMYDATPRGTFHAVAVGNLVEATVLKAIAGLGGGSQRQIGGENSPQRVALELLREVTDPGMRDLKVEVSGVQTAAVYPERLPNLAAGAQQILVGRYLPQAEEQTGDIIVTGRRGDETVRYATRIRFPADKSSEEGNSFIPRLWARQHLDHLLAQGASPAIQDEVIALSEEFHIITPYTSLLVLETDADRERFGVKRRFQIRDGERFFADGRDNANYELAQQQMRLAGDWRLGLRQQILASLSTLGRDTQVFQQFGAYDERFNRSSNSTLDISGRLYEESGISLGQSWYALNESISASGAARLNSPMSGGGFGGGGGALNADFDEVWDPRTAKVELPEFQTSSGSSSISVPDGGTLLLGGVKQMRDDGMLGFSIDDKKMPMGAQAGEWPGQWSEGRRKTDLSSAGFEMSTRMPFRQGSFGSVAGNGRFEEAFNPMGGAYIMGARFQSNRRRVGGRGFYDDEYQKTWPYQPGQWLDPIIPALAAPYTTRTLVKPPASGWSDEAIEISKSLVRTDALRQMDGGIEIRRTSESFDPAWDRRTTHDEQLELYSPTAWLRRPLGEGVHTIVNWCMADERGAYSRAFELGRVRTSTPDELREPPLSLMDQSLAPMHKSHLALYEARVERPAAGRIVLVVWPKNEPQNAIRFTIDAERRVLLERESFSNGKATSTTTFADFTQVAGVWWARQIETRDVEGALVDRVTQSVESLDADAFQTRLAEELPSRAARSGSASSSTLAPASGLSAGLLIKFPLPALQKAKEAVVAGGASLEAHLVVLIDHVLRQQWDPAFERLAAMEAIASSARPDESFGLNWVRMALQTLARRNAPLLERLRFNAARLPISERPDEWHVANHVLDVAGSIADANEQLRLLDLLLPTFDEQPEFVGALTAWRQRRVDLLRNLGRAEDMLPLHRAVAESVPWDFNRQISYARDLFNAGQRDAAYAWLRQELDRNPRRADYEKHQLAFAEADWLHEEGRYADEADFMETRASLAPADHEVYSRYLSALVFADRLEQAEGLVIEWLAIGEGAEGDDVKVSALELARLQAAVNYALGQRRNLNVYRFEEKWLAPLATTALRFAAHVPHSNITGQIISDWRFSDTDEADGVRRELFQRLKAEARTLSPLQLSQMIGWVIGGPPITSNDDWRDIAAVIRERWSASVLQRHALGDALVTIYSNRFADSEYLTFLRLRIYVTDKQSRAAYVSQLFEALMLRPWSEALEVEAFAVLPQLSNAVTAVDRLVVELPALYRLVDRLIAARVQHDRDELQATGHPEKLTRLELEAKYAEFLQAARQGVADRLADVAARRGVLVRYVVGDPSEIQRLVEAASGRDALGRWMQLERMTLDVQLERRLEGIATECWNALGDAPPKAVEGEPEVDPEAAARAMRSEIFDAMHRGRAFSIVTYLTVRRDAKPELVDRLMAFIDAGIAQGGDGANAWRGAKHDLLIALDRAQDLERELRKWIAEGGSVSPWRASLGRLLAERGKLVEAIGVFEAIRSNDALAPADLAALAQWYLAVDRRADYERATVDAYMSADEWTLRQMIDGHLQLWRNPSAALPSELDQRVLLTFQALFRKSNSPGDYAWLLREFYMACRDFRLLRMVPDAVIGRTPQQVYPFLQSFDGTLFGEVRDEAVADEILGRTEELKSGDLSPLDRRALDLLTAMIERRSSEVLNQPGPHADAAVAALQQAFRIEWADGERLQMARLLTNFGRITAPALAAEQVRELRELQGQVEAGSLERLQITGWLARALFDSHDRPDEAIAGIASEVGEFHRQREGAWPMDATEPLETYIGLLERSHQYAEAETQLKRLGEKPATPDMEHWFAERLDSVYLAALDGDGQVSLGSGEELYRNLKTHIFDEFDTTDQEHRYQLVVRALDLFYRANQKPALQTAAKVDLRRFAMRTLPDILARQTVNYTAIISQTADRLNEINGARAGLRFLIARLENYPAWLDMTWNNGWNEFGARLADWRENVGGNLGALEPRLLKLTLAELRRDLTLRESRNRHLYEYRFWGEKAGDFAAVAREILAHRRSSSRSVTYIAAYLWGPLNLHDEAIAALARAHRDEVLDDGGQQTLVHYLHEESRFGESIAILEALIERLPDDLNQRKQLMVAYHRTERPEDLRELRTATDAHFRQGGRWTESAVATLADACRATGLNDLAVDYYLELIALVQRQQPGGGAGGESLPQYYRGLAETYSALGQTEKAVDAAAGAVVSWGPNIARRDECLNTLRAVLTAANDLDAYAATLDRKAEETGEDSPLIRKMLGEAFLAKNQFTAAEKQLRAAIELEPTDLAAYDSLVKALDAQQKADAAAEALLAAIDVDRRNLTLLNQLADRLAGNESQAERAASMLVEASPQEAENHAALAQRRQTQNRWADAINQWQHVARIRSLEPDGLLKLATAQIHEQRWNDADATVKKLLTTKWPARFGDLSGQLLQMQQQIAAGRDAE